MLVILPRAHESSLVLTSYRGADSEVGEVKSLEPNFLILNPDSPMYTLGDLGQALEPTHSFSFLIYKMDLGLPWWRSG